MSNKRTNREVVSKLAEMPAPFLIVMCVAAAAVGVSSSIWPLVGASVFALIVFLLMLKHPL